MEIYQIAVRPCLWEMSRVAIRAAQKKAEAEARARELYTRLMALPRTAEIDSNNKWCERAGVSTSFFTQLRGRDNKPPSEPSVGNLRLILQAAGTTIPEFFIEEAEGRLAQVPNAQALERAFLEAMPELPKRAERRPKYLAEVVLHLFGLLPNHPANQDSEDSNEESGSEAGALPRAATKRA